MLKFVQAINVPVSDQDRAADFYVNKLGFEKTSNQPPRSEPWGQWAQFTDPDGNEYGVWAPPQPD